MSGSEPTAFLALWNGIASEDARAEYEHWHTFEHVPERTALPGFLNADRYRSVDAARSFYFTHYRLASLDALDSPFYRDVFTHPTDWSARMRPTLCDFYRLPCMLAGTHGASRAPRVATLRWRSIEKDLSARLNAWLDEQLRYGRLVHAEWGWAPPTEAYWKPNADSDVGGEGPEHTILLQHYDAPSLDTLCAALSDFLAPLATGLGTAHHFELQSTVQNPSVDPPLTERLAPHTAFFNHYNRG
ncbi:DUF4286 family protein [Hydrogenophaga sp.]|uniref:DUF4286 family protein n=1 Tax=Hydrogenophaga sp. TaxID=1904254 RepID=UPI0027194F08|nr:DUF4286 family protein [Hydrogenophaga sp.]MDO9435170.1 hypothetical protein [Hydrogenophaga sp.]